MGGVSAIERSLSGEKVRTVPEKNIRDNLCLIERFYRDSAGSDKQCLL